MITDLKRVKVEGPIRQYLKDFVVAKMRLARELGMDYEGPTGHLAEAHGIFANEFGVALIYDGNGDPFDDENDELAKLTHEIWTEVNTIS